MGNDNLQIFADRLRLFRKQIGATQKEFVEGLSITPSALSSYEKNNINPSIATVKEIAEKYNLSIDWLVGLTDNESNDKELKLCSDVIELLLKIGAATEIEIGETHYEVSVMNHNTGYPESIDIIAKCLIFENLGLRSFLAEWERMKTIYENGTIDKEVYSLWVEKTLMKYKTVGLESGLIDVPSMMEKKDE